METPPRMEILLRGWTRPQSTPPQIHRPTHPQVLTELGAISRLGQFVISTGVRIQAPTATVAQAVGVTPQHKHKVLMRNVRPVPGIEPTH